MVGRLFKRHRRGSLADRQESGVTDACAGDHRDVKLLDQSADFRRLDQQIGVVPHLGQRANSFGDNIHAVPVSALWGHAR
jgi:hypothetical protein